MRTYRALQRKKDCRWDFCCDSKAVGYCQEFREWWKDSAVVHAPQSQIDKYMETQDKFHITGHATKEEAAECYKQYLLDHRLQFIKDVSAQRMCEVCKEWTQGIAEIDACILALCDRHQTREDVARLFRVSETMWVS